MNTRRIPLVGLVLIIAFSATLLWLTTMATAQSVEISQPASLAKIATNTLSKSSPIEPRLVVFPPGPWPWYAQGEIHVHPEPIIPGHPVEICAEVINTDQLEPKPAFLEFGVAPLGIGLLYEPIGATEIEVPPGGRASGCIGWVPPHPGSWGIQVLLFQPGLPEPSRSLRNIDIEQTLQPGVPHVQIIQVRNPLTETHVIRLELLPNPELVQMGWGIDISPRVLPDMPPGGILDVALTVTPPAQEILPPDGTLIADVEGWIDAEGEQIGGFRIIYRPPVPLHRFPNPPYAENEISVHPYPPQAGEPMEICVEVYNPTPEPQEVSIQFSWANFGIGLPFNPIDGPITLVIPPFSIIHECIHWVPPIGGHLCVQVELSMAGQQPQVSQRNLDVNEPLLPGIPHQVEFPVRNPHPEPVTISLGLIPHLPDWGLALNPDVLKNVQPGEMRIVTLTVEPPAGTELPPDGHPIVDVEAYIGSELIGGFRKVFRPPVPLHIFPDPPYAEREISVNPYPLLTGEPTEICVELRNPTHLPQEVAVQFSWAPFGIGLPFTPINGLRVVHLPPFSLVRECIHWVPPVSGHVCLQAELFIDNYQTQSSRLNLDVNEPLEPDTPHSQFFPVRNPFEHPVTVTLGLIPHIPGWGIELSEDMLTNMNPGEVREVMLTVIPAQDLPPDQHPIVDVEAFGNGIFIGGFRKIFRPPVPIHQPKDPIYAESEIFIHPYPPRPYEPTEIGAEIRNPTEETKFITITFSAANFGIGLPFFPIHDPILVEVPPMGIIRPAVMWVPPDGGLWCIQIELQIPGTDNIFYSQRNIDVGEPFEPFIPHPRPFLVRNPFNHPVTITLGLIPHLPDWELELSQDLLRNMSPGETREVSLTVTPPGELPPDEFPIVDVEAYVQGQLIGGFRKIYRPPVPIHRPRDPVYAESEIGIDPYPVLPGQPVELSVEVFNPTDVDHIVTATFSVASFGIGMPFSSALIAPNPIRILVPAHGAARGHVLWTPPHWEGKFCVRVELQIGGHEPIWSQRNIDVGEPLEPGQPHTLSFPVGGWPFQEPVTVSLGMVMYQEGWEVSLSHQELNNVSPGNPVTVSLTVTPPLGANLGNGEPVVDVEAFVNGELIGGFRKLNVPPFPLHKPHEKGYAESEIAIDPDPPILGLLTQVSTVIQNNGDLTETVAVAFGWAQFGMGIPFTTTQMFPNTTMVTIGPHMTQTASTEWVPSLSGSTCVMIHLTDLEGIYSPQVSQRNVHVEEPPDCGQTTVFTYTVYNDSPYTATIDVGMISFNVPEDWVVTVAPGPTIEIGAYEQAILTVTVTIPCPETAEAFLRQRAIINIQEQAGSVPTIDVEGYNKGVLVGGIELRFQSIPVTSMRIYLPIIRR